MSRHAVNTLPLNSYIELKKLSNKMRNLYSGRTVFYENGKLTFSSFALKFTRITFHSNVRYNNYYILHLRITSSEDIFLPKENEMVLSILLRNIEILI